MSIIWIALWVLLSAFILGIFVWTTKALQDQKRAWQNFAKKRGLAYRSDGFLKSATVTGKTDGYDFYLSSEERATPDIRGRKFVTVAQWTLPIKMPTTGIVASGDYRDFAAAMTAPALPLVYDGWEAGKVAAKSDLPDLLTAYFTPERLRVLDTLMKQKGVSVLFLFDPVSAYVRLETGDPMLKTEQLDKLVAGVTPMLKVF